MLDSTDDPRATTPRDRVARLGYARHSAMCRVLAYLGRPVLLEHLLYAPDSSLVAQVYDAELFAYLNLAGCGFAAWDRRFPDPDSPLHYRTASLPTFDRNLRSLAQKLTASAVVAHVRGVRYDDRETVTVHNAHPFHFEGTPVTLAMNGTLDGFPEMRYDLLPHVRPELARRIEGTTDSEWVYALVLSQLPDPRALPTPEQLEQATEGALRVLREIRAARGLDTESDINLVVADGRTIVATRFTYDYGWYPEEETYYSKRRRYEFTSLWCTAGAEYARVGGEWIMRRSEHAESVILASEPITKDSSSWVEVPEYAILTAALRDGALEITARELML
jgi:glutamine amidotransferase